MLLLNTFEGGTDATAISAANSGGASGNAFDTITGTAPNFSILHPSHGSLGLAMQGTGAAQWTSAGGSFGSTITTMWGGSYLYFTATPSVVVHGPSLTTPTGAVASGFWEVSAAAKVVHSCKGTAVTSATTLSANTVYRIEWMHFVTPSGTCTWDTTIYLGESLVPVETMTQATGAGVSTDTNINAVKWGSTNAVTANTVFLDSVTVNDFAFPGPFWVPPTPRPIVMGHGHRGAVKGPPIFSFRQFSPPAAAPVTNFLTLTASQATTGALVKQVGKPIATSETATAGIAKLVGKSVSATETTSASLVKLVGRTLTASQASSAALVKQAGKVLTATQASSATLAKQVGKILAASEAATASVTKFVTHSAMTATQTTTAVVVKQVRKTLTTTQATSASLVASLVHLITLVATQASTAVLVKQVQKPLAASQATSATVAKRVAKTLTASQASTGSLVKQVGKIITAAQATSATLVKSVAHLVTIAVSQATTAAVVKQIRKPLTAAQATTASTAKRVGKVVQVVQASAASLAALVNSTVHAVTGIFSSNPSAGVADNPVDGFYGDNPQGGTGSNPRGGGFDG